jgi:hypothetical protein
MKEEVQVEERIVVLASCGVEPDVMFWVVVAER